MNAILEAQGILIDLKTELQKGRNLWLPIEKNNPNFEQASEKNWRQKHARCWLHGGTDLMEIIALEKWIFDNPPLSESAKEKAATCIKCWKEWLEQTDKYYGDFDEFEIEKPLEDETLYAYLLRTAETVEREGKGARLEWRALKSFLGYMRKIAPEEIAFIEQIFPKKMDIRCGTIIRKNQPEVYAIPQEAACSILCELQRMVLEGRPNSRLSALESLGLCWMCLTASRLRLPTYVEMIEKVEASSICTEGDYPVIWIPTLFGSRKIRISKRVAGYLLALSRIPSKFPRKTILQCPKRTLTRTFDRAFENCALNPAFGNITYVTMLSPPHHFDNHRYIPK